jgi:exodeoxyribonuclease V alpha subunit
MSNEGETERLSGVIERVTFHNSQTGFAVLRVQPDRRGGIVTVVGTMPSAVAGEYVEATGAWVVDREHGMQFRAESIRATPPSTVEGIEKYLGSGLIKGIGPHFARKIVAVFGERTLTVIDESPAFLKEVKGIGPRRIQQIRESWREQQSVRNIMVFLQSHGVGTDRALRIYKMYGDRAIDLVRENPYRLASDLWGIGFKTADELAQRIGIDRASPLRARAALSYVLQQLSHEGHCGFPEPDVIGKTETMTGIDATILNDAVTQACAQDEIIRESWANLPSGEPPWLYLKSLFLAEAGVARAIGELRTGSHPLPSIDNEAAIRWVEGRMGLQLSATQCDAIRMAVTSKVLVITGGPGVGKTTLVRGILEVFTAKGMRCGLCAPTGRAAKRLSETTGQEAKTIHRLLEVDPAFGGFKRNRENPLDVDLLLVDETSMVDIVLMNQLLRAVPKLACLVLVGDVDQLPSIGPGTVLADVINSGTVPVVRLTEIFRQASASRIIRAAHRVNEGQRPESSPDDKGDFYFIEANEPNAIIERIITLLRDRIPARFGLDSVRDVQVLTPMNRSELGSRALNERLQAVLNPAKVGPQVQRYGWTFRVGDKVLQTQNNYQKEVFNGDIGKVSEINESAQELSVAFEGKFVTYDYGELDELALAFAMTVHKSQGSEYPAVVMPLHTQHFLMLQRNLLYTAITRGKKLVVLVGSLRALQTAVQRQDNTRRCSALVARLRQALR